MISRSASRAFSSSFSLSFGEVLQLMITILEHAIAKAILDQNPKAAKSAMHAHIESSLKRFSPKAAAAKK